MLNQQPAAAQEGGGMSARRAAPFKRFQHVVTHVALLSLPVSMFLDWGLTSVFLAGYLVYAVIDFAVFCGDELLAEKAAA